MTHCNLFGWILFLLSIGTTHAQLQIIKDIPIHVGAGCGLSNYTALKPPGQDPQQPSFQFVYDPELGEGLYVFHVRQFNLPRNDTLIIRAMKETSGSPQKQVLAGKNTTRGSFYTNPVAGNGFIVELYKSTTNTDINGEACIGFVIDGFRFTRQTEDYLETFMPYEIVSNSTTSQSDESLCGQDESKEAACSESALVEKSRGVARLVISKDNNLNIAYCTGFLLGCEGHLLTNQHCVRNWMDALNTVVEFHAESPQCVEGNNVCNQRGACPGNVIVHSPSLVAVSTDLDYALLKLSLGVGTSDATELLKEVGGYLQLRSSGAVVDEEIFIPQHPLGWGKRIASTDNGQPGRIDSLAVTTCGGPDIGYNVDTQEGSSGSPVIAVSDKSVIGLHHCGGCLNGAIPSQRLIQDFENKGVLPRCAIA